jgi:hypothetical protein
VTQDDPVSRAPTGSQPEDTATKPEESFFGFTSFGKLLENLESSERAFQANTRSAERQEATHGPLLGMHARIQAAALLFHPDPAKMPGIDRIEALVNADFGTKLTSESVRKLRGSLCGILNCGTEHANALSMLEAADIIEQARRPTTARLRADWPATNLAVIAGLIGNAEITAVFDPYLDNAALQHIVNILSLCDGFISPAIRLLSSPKAQQRSRGIPRLTKPYVDLWLSEVGATAGELRLMGASGEHRRFLLLSGGKTLILGPSLNSLDKNEAISIETDTEDAAFFESSWLASVPLT